MSDRNLAGALRWAEDLTGGTIVGNRAQQRWRPQHFLTFRMPSGDRLDLLLRGWRAPGLVETEQRSRDRLAREALVLEALDGTAIRSPAYRGYEPEGGWILMECLEGDDLLTGVEDPARQASLFSQYIDDIAAMHALDPAELGLVDALGAPPDPETNARRNYRLHRDNYRADDNAPDPLLELAWWWLDRNRPAPVERYSLCTGDIGANQFMFAGDRYRALFDVEMAYIGDPLQDIGLMRYRNMCYPAARFDEVVRHYHVRAGRRIDRASLNYWTVVGLLGVSPTFARLRAQPDPAIPMDMTLLWGMQSRRRGLVAALQQIHGLPTPPLPAPPAERRGRYDAHHRFVAESIAAHHVDAAPDAERHRLGVIGAHSEVALRCARHGDAVDQADLHDLASLLPRRPADAEAGLRALTEAILADPERDLARRLDILFAIECRREFLLEPAIRAAGFASFAPLDPLGRAGE